MSAEQKKAGSHYGNFKDPFGLAKRMVMSGNRAAHSALFRETLSAFTKPVDWLLSKTGVGQVPADTSTPSQHPVVLIVGPPRSGTTMAYQVLARYCDVTYPDNLSSLFPRTALAVSKRFSRRTPTRKALIKSCYGQTSRFSGPNEGFYIWNRFLGSNRYEVAEIGLEKVEQMNRYFSAWTSMHGKPLLNKNNRNTTYLDRISQMVPNSYFIVVYRDAYDIARSVIRGREFVQGSKTIPWGLHSMSDKGAVDPLGYVDDVCEQVKVITRRINAQLISVPVERIVMVDYATICQKPAETIHNICARIPGLTARTQLMKNELKPYNVSTNHPLSPAEEERLAACLGVDNPETKLDRCVELNAISAM